MLKINEQELIKLFVDNDLMGDKDITIKQKPFSEHGNRVIFTYNFSENSVEIIPVFTNDLEQYLRNIVFYGISGERTSIILDCLKNNRDKWLIEE